jgi:hypothetical protein
LAEQRWFAIKATTLDRMQRLKNYTAGLARGAVIEEAKNRVNAAAEEIGVENEGFANAHMMTRYTYNYFRAFRNPLDLETYENIVDAQWMRVRQAVKKGLRDHPDTDPILRKALEDLAN